MGVEIECVLPCIEEEASGIKRGDPTGRSTGEETGELETGTKDIDVSGDPTGEFVAGTR